MRGPRVSVILPVRNCERFVGEAVRSILTQTLADLELIVVDDGSTDGTPRQLAQLAAQDVRLKVLTRSAQGLVAAVESARRTATSRYLARMDADDIALPERLELQVRYLDDHPDVVAVGGQVQRVDAEARPLRPMRYPVAPETCRAYLAFGSPFCHPAVTLRADAVDRCGGYRDTYADAEDFDLWLRLSKIGELANLENTVLHYRVHGAGITKTRARQQANATALALVDAKFGIEPLARSRNLVSHKDDWRVIESWLPAKSRHFARSAYFRALALNGGIVQPDQFAFLKQSLPDLHRDARATGHEDVLAFTLVRAAYHLLQAAEPARASWLLLAALRALFYPVMAELCRSVLSRLSRFWRRRKSGRPEPCCNRGESSSQMTGIVDLRNQVSL
jgi:glycosyltransferase involved in cell wall biosynthesis